VLDKRLSTILFCLFSFLFSLLSHQPISALGSSTNQHRLVSTSISTINTTKFVLSSHSSVILDERYTKTFESFKTPFSRLPHIKRDVSYSQSFTEVPYHQIFFQIIIITAQNYPD